MLALHDDVEAAAISSRQIEQLEGGVGEVEHHTVRLDETLHRRLSGGNGGKGFDELGSQVGVEATQDADVRMKLDAMTAEVELEDAHG